MKEEVGSEKLPGLQVARAVAALAVVYFHSSVSFRAFPENHDLPFAPLAQHGYLGVHFFFAISGFVICLVTSKRNFSLWEFFVHRVFRLYPVYFLFFFLTFALLYTTGWKVAGATFADRDWLFLLKTLTFFPLKEGPLYDVTWSLEHEVVFYAIAALIVPLGGVWLLGAVLLTLTYVAYAHAPGVWDYHLVVAPHYDFLAGVIAFVFRSALARIGVIVPLCLGLFGYYAVTVLQIPYSGAVGEIFLVTAFLNLKLDWQRRPARLALLLGDASYSIYISHWFLVYLAIPVSMKLNVIYKINPEVWRFFTIAICCGISVLLWKFYEKPLIDLGRRVAKWRLSVRQPQPLER